MPKVSFSASNHHAQRAGFICEMRQGAWSRLGLDRAVSAERATVASRPDGRPQICRCSRAPRTVFLLLAAVVALVWMAVGIPTWHIQPFRPQSGDGMAWSYALRSRGPLLTAVGVVAAAALVGLGWRATSPAVVRGSASSRSRWRSRWPRRADVPRSREPLRVDVRAAGGRPLRGGRGGRLRRAPDDIGAGRRGGWRGQGVSRALARVPPRRALDDVGGTPIVATY